MPQRRVKVVCTGRGKHKRHIFNDVDVSDGELRVNEAKAKNMPEFAGQTIDGVPVVPFTIVRTYNPRHGDGWRWECPRCPMNARFANDADAYKWIATAGRVADISRRS